MARGLAGQVITRLELRGFRLIGAKIQTASREVLTDHYLDLRDRPFFPRLLDYMLSGPIMVLIVEGLSSVSTIRKMLGATNPLEAAPGTIRGDYCLDVSHNLCHASDSVSSANREIGLWFKSN